MATFEDRLAAIEREQAELKQNNAERKEKIELHTFAIGGLVNKALLERLNEKNDNLFKALGTHDDLTNMQLAEMREKIELIKRMMFGRAGCALLRQRVLPAFDTNLA